MINTGSRFSIISLKLNGLKMGNIKIILGVSHLGSKCQQAQPVSPNNHHLLSIKYYDLTQSFMSILIKFCLMSVQSSLRSTLMIFGFLIMITTSQFFRPQQKVAIFKSGIRSKAEPWFGDALPVDIDEPNQYFDRYFKCAFNQWRYESNNSDARFASYQSYKQEKPKNGQRRYKITYKTIKGKKKNVVLTNDEFASALIFTPQNVWVGVNFMVNNFGWADVVMDPAVQHIDKMLRLRAKRTDLRPVKFSICYGTDNRHRIIFENYEIEYQVQGQKFPLMMGMDLTGMMTSQMLFSPDSSVPNFRNYPSYDQIVNRTQQFFPEVNRNTINGLILRPGGGFFGGIQFGLNGYVDIKLPSHFTSLLVRRYVADDDYRVLSLASLEAEAVDRIERRGRDGGSIRDKRMILFGQMISSPYSYMAVYETPQDKQDITGTIRLQTLKKQVDEEMIILKPPSRK